VSIPGAADAPDGSVLLLGHFQAGVGLGTAARGTAAALQAAGLAPLLVDLDRPGEVPVPPAGAPQPVTLVPPTPTCC
jgi:hypothetical protein